MASSLRILAILGAWGAICACAHAAPPDLTQGAELPPLGEDMPQEDAAAAPASIRSLSIDMPVGKLCGHPQAKAIVDRDLPGLTTRPEYIFFKRMSLRQLQAASGGKMPIADLDKVSLDLNALDGPAAGPLVRASASLR